MIADMLTFRRLVQTLYFLSALFAIQPVYTQTTFSKAQIQSDIKFAYKVLKEKHPGLYRYIDKKDLQAVVDDLINQAQETADHWQAYSHISQLTSFIKCGHTRLFANEQEWNKLKNANVFFPFPVRWLNDSLYVNIDTIQQNQNWWRVQGINDIRFDSLLHFLEQRFALDGDSRKGKQLFLDNLAYYYALWKQRPESFSLQLISLDELRDTTLRVSGVNWKLIEDIRSKKSIVFGTGKLFPFSFTKTNNQGLLTIRNFNSDRHKSFGVSLPSFLDSVFRVVQQSKIDHLVIDIRNNGGGDDVYGALLYSYLINKPFLYFKEVVKLQDNKFTPVKHPQLQLQQPNSFAFKGKVTLLIDGFTFSTAADFASLFKEQKRGNIIGMETGGGFQGNNSGTFEEILLPNTGVVLDIPLWRYMNAVKHNYSRNGVIPDLHIIPNKSWLEGKTDWVLKVALEK